MSLWPDENWLAKVAAACGDLPVLANDARPALSGSVSLAVTIASRREVGVNWAYTGGVPGVGEPSVAPGADLVLGLASIPDAAGVFSGKVTPSVAFMRGRLKAAGDGRLLLSFLASTTSDDFVRWLKRFGPVPV